MKKAIKEYFAYTPYWCTLFQMVILPIFCIFLMIGSYYFFGSRDFSWLYLIEFVVFVPCMEIVCDYQRFGGFCSKHVNYTEYFMFAGKCKKRIRRILIVDTFRRILMIAGVFLFGQLFILLEPAGKMDIEMSLCLCGKILMAYVYSVIGSVIVRLIEGTMFAWLTVGLFGYVVLFWYTWIPAYPGRFLMLAGVLSLIGSVVCIWMCMRKVEKSFYDKED